MDGVTKKRITPDLDAMAVFIAEGATPTVPVVASGESTAAAANAVVADSGELPAGAYRVEITMGFSGAAAAGKHLAAQHRNAANGANVAPLALCPAGGAMGIVLERVDVAEDERIRVVVGAVAAIAAEVTQAHIRVYPL